MTKIVFGGVGEGLVAINALRCAAANALGEIGDEKSIPELLTVLNSNNSDDLDVHDAVAKALANFIT
jgi:HEAT repeat protein